MARPEAILRNLAAGVKKPKRRSNRKGSSRAVKTVEMSEATKTLAECAQGVGTEPLVVTQEGKPVAVLLRLENTDLETISLSSNPRFLALIERSRSRLVEEGGLSSEEVRRQVG